MNFEITRRLQGLKPLPVAKQSVILRDYVGSTVKIAGESARELQQFVYPMEWSASLSYTGVKPTAWGKRK